MDHRLEHLFCWRWLLPWSDGARVLIKGFGAADRNDFQSLESNFSCVQEGEEFDQMIINGDVIDKCDLSLTCSNVVVLGGCRAVARYCVYLEKNGYETLRFAFLPSSRPRIILPIDTIEHIRLGLALHRPGSFVGRIALVLLEKLALLGIKWPMNRRGMLLAWKGTLPAPWGINRIGLSHSFGNLFALYLGTINEKRKVVALPMTDVNPSVIFKVADTLSSGVSVGKEIDTLRFLAGTIVRDRIPRLHLSAVRDDGGAILVQEFRRSVARPKSEILDRELVRFHRDLFLCSMKIKSFDEWIDLFLQVEEEVVVATKLFPRIIEEIRHLGLGRYPICLSFRHGDFAEWNISWTQDGLFVFDWEEFSTEGVALSDVFRYVCARAILLTHGAKPDTTVKKCIESARVVLKGYPLERISVEMQLVAWCMEQLNGYAGDFYAEMAEVCLLSLGALSRYGDLEVD